MGTNNRLSKTLFELNTQLDDDLEFLFVDRIKPVELRRKDDDQNKGKAESNLSRKQFVDHLVTVISHPVGLKASISPFNATPEVMLAHLMEMFSITETQIKKMLIKHHLNDLRDAKSSYSLDRSQAWRPQLRMRINPPVLQMTNNIKPNFVESLIVKIYLVKTKQKPKPLSSPASSETGELNRIIDSIRFKRVKRLEPIKFTNKILAQARFLKNLNNEYLQFVLVGKSAGKNLDKVEIREGDICLRIRRHYCDPGSLYKLHLEFWSLEKGYNIFSKILSATCCTRRKISLLNKFSKIYGFAFIDLDQIPSYACKLSLPIVSVDEQRIDHCEINFEFKNRQLTATNNNSIVVEDFNIESATLHVRLYAFCVAYQMSLIKVNVSYELQRLVISQTGSNPTLDNILFLPAYSILNQHRLQSNITRSEDQSILRSALLLLLIRFSNKPFANATKAQTDFYKLLLLSIVEHEYLNGHRLFDSMLKQESESFRRERARNNSRQLIISLEREAIQSFTNSFLSSNCLQAWLSRVDSLSYDKEKSIILASLNLVRTIINHNKNNTLVDSSLRDQAWALEDHLSNSLTTAITNNIKDRIRGTSIEYSQVGAVQNLPTQKNSNKKGNTKESLPSNSWQKLLCNIQTIENDVTLNWLDGGFKSLSINGDSIFDDLSTHMDKNSEKLKKMIQSRMKNYLERRES